MALPKEPRQKMINMMYLVLTALLALNVSTEVLNAFKTVNTSIDNANATLAANSNTIYASFAQKVAEAETREKASIWKPKADAAKAMSDKVYNYIETLKDRLKREAGYNPEEGDTTFAIDNLDAATRLFEKQGQGDTLKMELDNLKKNLLSIDPEIAKEFANKLPINTDVPKSQTGSVEKSFATSYFYMTPTIAGLTILSKFQNDIKNSENQIVTYCHNQIGAVAVRYDKFGFVGGLSSSYLMPGEKLKVYAGLGATSSGAAPTITINGRPAALNADGIAETEFPVSGSGSVNVVIRYKDQDGNEKTIPKLLEYTVGQPSGVAVSADKMNVLYIGVENPMTITAGVGAEKVNATFSGGSITRVNGPKWIAKPTTPGEHNVNVVVDGKSTPVRYRVKYLPDPAAFVANKRGGNIPAAEFKAQGGIIARLLDSDFEASFKVVSFSGGAVGGKYSIYQPFTNNGNRWSGATKDIIDNAGPGTTVFLDAIQVVGPDGRTRTLPGIAFNLK